MPVDLYIGGAEHAIMHLLYSRFIHKFLVEDKNSEPFTELVTQGLVQALVYEVEGVGNLLEKEFEVRKHEFKGLQVKQSFQKQSKSKNTGINPLEIIQSSSVDIFRLALSFAAPPENTLRFQNQLLATMRTWLFKVNNTLFDLNDQHLPRPETSSSEVLLKVAQLVQDYHHHLDKSRHVHVAVAKLMELRSFLQKSKESLNQKDANSCGQLLIAGIYPFAPNFAAYLWSKSGEQKKKPTKIEDFRWEDYQMKILKNWREFEEGLLNFNIQVNGKFIGSIVLKEESLQPSLEDAIRQEIKVQKLKGKFEIEKAKKVLILREKGVVNFVI